MWSKKKITHELNRIFCFNSIDFSLNFQKGYIKHEYFDRIGKQVSKCDINRFLCSIE